MNKLTKPQITHLKTRMNEGLRKSISLKFPKVIVTNKEIMDERKRILKVLQLPDTTSTYYLDSFVRSLLAAPPSTEERSKYQALQQTRIEGVLDAAILGGCDEALEALKDFQAGL
jgi:hypothetical protein